MSIRSNLTSRIAVFQQSAIRIETEAVIYVDPFGVPAEYHDADIILLTHNHPDHFSPKDILKVRKDHTTFVFPRKMERKAKRFAEAANHAIIINPGERIVEQGIPIEAIPAYNRHKPFHPKSAGWNGYILTVEGQRVYIAGDTDQTYENSAVQCDIALVPIGGIFTMNAREAANLVNTLRPQTVVPIHYGSIVGKKEDADEFRDLVNKEITVEIKL